MSAEQDQALAQTMEALMIFIAALDFIPFDVLLKEACRTCR